MNSKYGLLSEEKTNALVRLIGTCEGPTSEVDDEKVLVETEVEGYRYILIRIPAQPLENLSTRQREVAQLAGDGHSVKEIAWELGLSRPTVAKHLRRVYEKLEVNSRAGLAKKTLALK